MLIVCAIFQLDDKPQNTMQKAREEPRRKRPLGIARHYHSSSDFCQLVLKIYEDAKVKLVVRDEILQRK